uniref:UORF n=1 Tax=Trypanosoma cruzi TaxID=5693 RepID=A0A076JRC7_TRYCR|nr:uORF [Trypanosoma cruzi]AII77614.1 uORF [Trypanosoma cruzi]AII77618.1 uORF [Trypanosoma cruzi]
MKCQCYRRPRV